MSVPPSPPAPRVETVDLSVDERSAARLFALADGVFAIAMTLLALDLKVPDIAAHPGGHGLAHALRGQHDLYVSFALSFYVIAGYWQRHHREMRNVRATSPRLIRRTMTLLLAVVALPFSASLLGTYGSDAGIAVTVYALNNALATAALLLIRAHARADHLYEHGADGGQRTELVLDLVADLLAAGSGYVFRGYGVTALVVLLVLSGVTGRALSHRQARKRS